MLFWIIATTLTLTALAALVLTMRRAKADAVTPAEFDLRVYRDQLRDVDRDLARGVIGAEDGEKLRREVSRRILAADAQIQADDGKSGKGGAIGIAAAIVAMVLIVGGAGTYLLIGAPGIRDMPLDLRMQNAREAYESRPSQAEYEATVPPTAIAPPSAEVLDLMERLRAAVAERPDDIEGRRLLVRNEAQIGDLTAAYRAQGEIIDILGDSASVEEYATHAAIMIAASEGYVSPEAEDSLRAVLEREPSHQLARYYWGLMMGQNDRPDLAFRTWETLLAEGPEDAPWILPIRARIEDFAFLAGIRYELPEPAALRGPSLEDMDAAADMNAQDRNAMIEGMVQGLSERLAQEGGTPQEWAQLIRALGVLNRIEDAVAIWQDAQTVFAQAPEALAIVREAAIAAGVAQ